MIPTLFCQELILFKKGVKNKYGKVVSLGSVPIQPIKSHFDGPGLLSVSGHLQLWVFFSKGLKNEFETAVVNEPSVFEPLKFYCSKADTYYAYNRCRRNMGNMFSLIYHFSFSVSLSLSGRWSNID